MGSIVALVSVSLSELQTFDNKYTEEWATDNPEELESVLYKMGLNPSMPYERQLKTHRNRFNAVITCSRFMGYERTDEEWINSGYASEEAKDKVKNNKLLNDLYRFKGLTEDRAAGVWEPEEEEKV
jgi:hypothetical protein